MRHGTRTVLLLQLASQAVSLAVLAGLYRLVAPADYGLLGMALPLVMLPRMLTGLSLSVAAVQQERLSGRQHELIFWLQVTMGLASWLVTAALGQWLAVVYGVDELRWLCPLLGGTSLVAALGNQHQTRLERELDVGRLAAWRLVAQLAGGASGLVVGGMGGGIWALVAQQYGELLCLTASVWWAVPWRPRRWPTWRGGGRLLSFGGYYALSTLLFFLAMNLDKLLLAWLLGESPAGQTALGVYTQAFNLMMKPILLVTTALSSILLPALVRARAHPATFTRLVADSHRLMGNVLFPVGVGLTLTGELALVVLGGEPWRLGGQLLAILAPAILLQGFIHLAGSLLSAVGRADRLAVAALVMALLLGQGYLLGVWTGGRLAPSWGLAREVGIVTSVAWSFSLVTWIALAGPYLAFCWHVAGVPWQAPLQALWPAARSAALMGLLLAGLGPLLRGWPEPLQLATLVAVGIAAYTALARRELATVLAQLSAP